MKSEQANSTALTLIKARLMIFPTSRHTTIVAAYKRAVAELLNDPTFNDRRREGADTAWSQGEASRQRGIIQQILHEQRQDGGRAVKKRAHQENQHHANGKITILQYPKV